MDQLKLTEGLKLRELDKGVVNGPFKNMGLAVLTFARIDSVLESQIFAR